MFVQGAEKQGDSLAALVLANSVPFFGVLFLGWSAAAVILLYWSENLIIGFFTLLKMATNRHSGAGEKLLINDKPLDLRAPMAKVFIAGFFMFHYGTFTVVHFVFILAIASSLMTAGVVETLLAVAVGFAALFASHGYSFLKNYIGNKENERISLSTLMVSPYQRVIVMHVFIFVGIFAVLFGGAAAVFGLMAVKTVIDASSHLSEHNALGNA